MNALELERENAALRTQLEVAEKFAAVERAEKAQLFWQVTQLRMDVAELRAVLSDMVRIASRAVDKSAP